MFFVKTIVFVVAVFFVCFVVVYDIFFHFIYINKILFTSLC
jgi:hypothetical protein